MEGHIHIHTRNIEMGAAWAFFCFLLGIWVLNSLYKFCYDDCIYGSSVLARTNGTCLNFLRSAWIANVNDGYRPVCHLIVRIFTGLGWGGKWVFNLLNTVVMGLFVVLAIRVANGEWFLSKRKIILAIALLYFLVTDGDAYLWCAGSVNYLWTSCVTLVMVILHERLQFDRVCGKPLHALVVVFLMTFAFVAGWMQEALSLPFLFAIGMYHLTRIRQLTPRTVLIWSAYFLGVAVLVMVAGRRAATVSFDIRRYAIGLVHICVNVIPLWLLMFFCVFKVRNKRDFLRRNEFFILMILGNVLMVLCIGWQGVHSLWACHLFATIILIREWNISNRWANFLYLMVAVVMVVAMVLQYRITREFESFRCRYLNSSERLTYHKKIDCGPFSRFVCQKIYKWQKDEQTFGFAVYNGMDGVKAQPITLPENLYYNLVERDSFCGSENLLPISFIAYGHKMSNAIVMPLDGNNDKIPVRCRQIYDLPKGVIASIWLIIENNFNPRAGDDEQVRLINVKGKRYILIPCYPSRLQYLKDIELYYGECDNVRA